MSNEPLPENVLPIRVRRGEPRTTVFRDSITPEQVRALFVDACSGRTQAKVPGLEACRTLASVLSMRVRRGEIVTFGLDEATERQLRKAVDALEPVIAAAEPYEDVIRTGTFQAALDALRRLQADAAFLLANFRRPEPTSWHDEACSIAGLASVAWATVMVKPPVATKAESPMTLFVKAALELTGRHYALNTVDQALRRGARGAR